MYVEYFGLTENPFSIAPDPSYLYMSERHREALAHLLYGLKSDGGFVLLTGEVGTGKTTTCRSLINQVPADVDLAFVLNPKVTVCELLETICDELHIPRPANISIKTLVDGLNARLLETNAQGRKTVLIIDEAQNLSLDVLEQLRLLTNLETARRKLLQIILLGQPELRGMISQPQMCQLAQRVTARYHLSPLDREDISAYIQHRLQVAGCDRMLFPAGTVKQIRRLTNGVPRLINLVCDRALLGAYTLKKAQVDASIVRRAGREVFDFSTPGRTMPRMAAILTGLVLAAGIGYGLANLNERSAAPAQALQTPVATDQADIQTTEAPSAAPSEGLERRTIVQRPTTWPEDFGFTSTSDAAFADLAALWGLAYLPGQDDPCSFAANTGLQCIDRRDSFESLRGFNRPAILTLYDDQGSPFYVLLAGLEGNQARFIANSQQRELDLTALESRWFGEHRLLWQKPGAFKRVLLPGGDGANVAWLASKLAELGLYIQKGDETRLEGPLLGALKRFQFSAGLTPDGVLGPQTIIHLNRALGSPGPRLHDTETS
jgi:general secretion pathway protein A